MMIPGFVTIIVIEVSYVRQKKFVRPKMSRMCLFFVVQAGVGLLHMDVMPIFMIIALDIIITMRFSINCLLVICSPTVIFAIMREATSETYGPGVSFPLY